VLAQAIVRDFKTHFDFQKDFAEGSGGNRGGTKNKTMSRDCHATTLCL
jgi:hypothetical protein